jgi:hypothetical protein
VIRPHNGFSLTTKVAGAVSSSGLPKKSTKVKDPNAPKAVRKPRAKKAPPRIYARWGVFDKAMKQVAIFDYNQRTAAEEKVTELKAKAKGDHFLQIVKEPMPELADPVAVAT